jgi:hypothetical protein
VGRQGASNPAFQVDTSTASSATGIKVKAAAAAGGVALSAITSGSNENLSIDAAGTGTVTIGGTSTGSIVLARATTAPSINGLVLASTDNSWTAPSFSAADFTGSGSMTWIVATANVTTYAYNVRGKVMTVAFVIMGSVVGNTPSAFLQIKIPGGFTAAKRMMNLGFAQDDGVAASARIEVAAGASIIQVYHFDSSPWFVTSGPTGNTSVHGEITFEIN